MTPKALADLRAVCEMAMAQPEELDDQHGSWTADPCPTCGGWHPVSHDCRPEAARNALAVALSPDVVLALLDRAAQAERLVDQVTILISNIEMIYGAESIADEDWALVMEDVAVARAALGDSPERT